jgi:hypothetical protein
MGSGTNKTITQDGVLTTLNQLHTGLTKHVNNKKFRNSFSLNYPLLQKGIQQQMLHVGKDEQ